MSVVLSVSALMLRVETEKVVAVLSTAPVVVRLASRMPAAALVVAALASNRSIDEVSMAMVWIETTPPAARERGDDVLGGVEARRARIDRQPVLARERRRAADAAQLLLQLRDFALDLGLVDAGLACGDELVLDLADDARWRCSWRCRPRRRRRRRGRGRPARWRAPSCPSASWSRSTSRRRCRTPLQRA